MFLRVAIFIFLFSSTIFGDTEVLFQEDENEFNPNQIVSIEIGGGSITRLKANTLSGQSSIKRDIFSGGIKLGAEDIGLRLFLSYRPLEINSILTHSFGIELDSIIDIASNFKFFYGLIGGAVLYEIVDQNQTSDYTKDLTPYYGVESGFIFAFSEKYELEIGGRYALTNINDKTADKSYVFDQFLNYYLAFNYKY